ncbi:MAG: hypothetical protein IJN43_07245 [Ruminococcus sp.]|nr:hypothetical protein [Ruminococcus sp.]
MKKIISYFLVSALSLSTMPATVTAIETNNQPANITSEKSQTTSYIITYKDIDTSAIDKQAEEKRAEYIYKLYEQELTQQEFERLSTEYYNNVRLELLEKEYSEKSTKILKEFGINGDLAMCSKYTPTIICPLTVEQKKLVEESDLIESVTIYTPIEIEPSTEKITYSTKEEFINAITGGKDAAEIFGEDIKIAAELNCKKNDSLFDYFIIYGLKSDRDIENAIDRIYENNRDLKIMVSPVENRSGTLFSISCEKINTSNSIGGFAFVDDEYPAWISKQSIESFSQTYNFNPLKYIINLGDTNGDYKIDSTDASDILELYAKLSTSPDLMVTDNQLKHYDVNADGRVDSSDASKILEYYAFLSTGGDCALKEFINK